MLPQNIEIALWPQITATSLCHMYVCNKTADLRPNYSSAIETHESWCTRSSTALSPRVWRGHQVIFPGFEQCLQSPTSSTNLSPRRLPSSLRTDSTDFTTRPFLLSISVFSFFIILFCLVPCGRLSWLLVSFWAHVNIVHRIISYQSFEPLVARCPQIVTGKLWFV